MRALSRSLAVAAVAGAVLVTTPAQASGPSGPSILSLVCGPDSRSTESQCDLFWLFRPCGPIVACP